MRSASELAIEHRMKMSPSIDADASYNTMYAVSDDGQVAQFIVLDRCAFGRNRERSSDTRSE